MENRSRSATAYPHPPPPNSTTTATAQTRRLDALTITSIIITSVLFGVGLMLYLIYRPSPPDFRVDSLALSNLNLNLNLSSSSITATWAAHLAVLNPNKKTTLHFHQLKAAVYYDHALLSVTAVQPFLVPPAGNGTAISATFAAVGAYVDEKVVEGINGSRRVVFNVRALARVRLSGRWLPPWDRSLTLRVYCEDLAVGMNSSTRECSVSESSDGGRMDQCLVW